MLTSTGEYPATTVAGLETNTLWDGVFHVSTWIAALAGVFLLASSMRAGFAGASRHLTGLILAGWGSFNLVEGTVDHHIVGIHHVRAGEGQWAYDLGFLLLGAGADLSKGSGLPDLAVAAVPAGRQPTRAEVRPASPRRRPTGFPDGGLVHTETPDSHLAGPGSGRDA